jgi:hypothetical protein
MIHDMTADRAGLQLIGVVLASLTASVILIASILVYKSAGTALDQQTNSSNGVFAFATTAGLISSAAPPDR